MYAVNSAQSLIMNYYFFLGLHTALHVKVGPLQHASLHQCSTCLHNGARIDILLLLMSPCPHTSSTFCPRTLRFSYNSSKVHLSAVNYAHSNAYNVQANKLEIMLTLSSEMYSFGM